MCAMAVSTCVSGCLLQTTPCSIETTERIELVPGKEATIDFLYPCCHLASYFEYTPYSRGLFLVIICKHDVIHKTGST